MNFAALFRRVFPGILTVWLCLPVHAQLDAEELRRLRGELADLREANVAYQRQISELRTRVEKLQGDLRDSNERATIKMGDYVTREDLKKIMDRIAEVDQKRENDRKVILDEFEKLGKTIVQTPPASSRGNRPKDREKEPEKEAAPVQAFEGNVYEYKVKENDRTLGHILDSYNEALKQEGRPAIGYSDVRKANPRLNPNRIFVGQTILLPVPDKK